MILENAKPRLKDAIEKANSTNKLQEVKFIHYETLINDTIISVFDWLFRQGIDFSTRRDEDRFVVIVHPKTTVGSTWTTKI